MYSFDFYIDVLSAADWQEQGVEWSSSVVACMACCRAHATYPGTAWATFCNWYHEPPAPPAVGSDVRAAKAAADTIASGKLLDLRLASASIGTSIEVIVQSSYDIYKGDEFLKKWGTSPEAAGVPYSMQVESQKGVAEEVVAVRDRTPRKLILQSKTGVQLSQGLLAHHLRPLQAKASFAYALKDILTKRGLRTKRRSKLLTMKMIDKKVAEAVAALSRGRPAALTAQESSAPAAASFAVPVGFDLSDSAADALSNTKGQKGAKRGTVAATRKGPAAGAKKKASIAAAVAASAPLPSPSMPPPAPKRPRLDDSSNKGGRAVPDASGPSDFSELGVPVTSPAAGAGAGVRGGSSHVSHRSSASSASRKPPRVSTEVDEQRACFQDVAPQLLLAPAAPPSSRLRRPGWFEHLKQVCSAYTGYIWTGSLKSMPFVFRALCPQRRLRQQH